MKRKLRYYVNRQAVEKDVNYIPVRFIFAIILAVLATLSVMAVVVLLSMYVPYFCLLMWATVCGCTDVIAFLISVGILKIPLKNPSMWQRIC